MSFEGISTEGIFDECAIGSRESGTVFWSEDSNATSFCVGRLVWDYHLWHIAYSDCIITYLSDHAYL